MGMQTPRLTNSGQAQQTQLLDKPSSPWKRIDENTDALMISGLGSLVRCQLNGLFSMVVLPNAYVHPVNDDQGNFVRYRLGEY